MTRKTLMLAGLLIGATIGTLHADWLVTKQGERFEIDGPYQVKGKVVVFSLPGGALSSMRTDQVDFDASQRATEQAKKDAAAPPVKIEKPQRKAVIVLTDKDFQKSPPPEDANADGKDKPAAPTNRSGVEIVRWDRVPANDSKADGVEIVGTLRNVTADVFTELTVTATFYDDNSNVIGRFPAVVDTQALPSGESSKFHLVASGLFAYNSVKFETSWKGVRGRPGTPVPAPSPGATATTSTAPGAVSSPPAPPAGAAANGAPAATTPTSGTSTTPASPPPPPPSRH
jgi:hypothetical protein